jgi:hypothetical protein
LKGSPYVILGSAIPAGGEDLESQTRLGGLSHDLAHAGAIL